MRHVMLQKRQQNNIEAAGAPLQALHLKLDEKEQWKSMLSKMRHVILQRQQENDMGAVGVLVQMLHVGLG
eukprot:1161539-Pelagomonas_calceolata.AAC.6